MLDLDGVVYVGPAAVPGAAAHLAEAASAGLRLAYVTNNASRPPATVAGHLRELGIPVADEDVVTSAQAAARLLAERFAPGSTVFVIGGEGLFQALSEQGLRPTQRVEDEPVAVVSGYAPDLRWHTVIDGAILVRDGLPWVVSNTDLTVPTPRGPGPGNGVLVRAVAEFSGVVPVVAGKPRPPLFLETQRRVGGRRPLVVGDRLDTDIEGAVEAGYDSLLVMTGVTGVSELVDAEPPCRPTYVGATLGALGRSHGAPERTADGWLHEGWSATCADGWLEVTGEGSPDAWFQLVAVVGWAFRDETGRPLEILRLRVPQH
jgi:HAD superfamily hydrolase (TIGR01450 family)